jgi:hypothetical protein
VDYVSSYLAVLVGLSEALEKNPDGAVGVGGLVTLATICQTIISINKKRK